LFEIFLVHIEDDRAFETSVQLCRAQGTFPSAFGPAIFHLVDMLEDEEIIENGATGVSERYDFHVLKASLDTQLINLLNFG